MRSERKSFLSSNKISRLDTYKSIDDLIVHLWWKIHETGEVTLLIKNKFKLSHPIVEHCDKLWDEIQDQHLQKFGMPPWYSEYLNQAAKLSMLKIDFALDEDRKHITWIKLAEIELEKLKPTGKVDHYRTKAIIEISLGIQRIDPYQMVVAEYSTLIGLAEEKSQSHGN